MKLNNRKIERIKPTGKVQRHADGLGLYLHVEPEYTGAAGKARGGQKRFVWRGTIAGRVTHIGLGRWPVTTLDAARDAVLEIKRTIRGGGDPRADRRETKRETRKTSPTFRHCLEQMFERKAGDSSDGGANVVKRLRAAEKYAAPLLPRPVATVEPGDVIEVLAPVWGRAVGRALRQDIRSAFEWARAAGHFTAQNPAGDCVKAMLGAAAATTAPRKAIHYGGMPALLRDVESCRTTPVNRLAWLFMAHTAARSGEVVAAEWSEIDGDVWTVPAERMKTNKEHVVPLNAEAMRVLREARELGGGRFVFPSARFADRHMSADGLTAVRDAAGVRAVMDNHGVRAVFKTWAAETTQFTPDVVESCLAHAVGGVVERTYNRGQMLDRRREVMDAYCRFLTGDADPANVVRIGA